MVENIFLIFCFQCNLYSLIKIFHRFFLEQNQRNKHNLKSIIAVFIIKACDRIFNLALIVRTSHKGTFSPSSGREIKITRVCVESCMSLTPDLVYPAPMFNTPMPHVHIQYIENRHDSISYEGRCQGLFCNTCAAGQAENCKICFKYVVKKKKELEENHDAGGIRAGQGADDAPPAKAEGCSSERCILQWLKFTNKSPVLLSLTVSQSYSSLPICLIVFLRTRVSS